MILPILSRDTCRGFVRNTVQFRVERLEDEDPSVFVLGSI